VRAFVRVGPELEAECLARGHVQPDDRLAVEMVRWGAEAAGIVNTEERHEPLDRQDGE
jgi:hypothetical protein